jgi:serine/threonine-protein kinase
VFKARALAEEAAGQVVALKIYFEEQVEERTAREITALRSFTTPTIVRLFDEGHCVLRTTPCIYLATSFIEGQTLSDRIAASPMSDKEVASAGRDIAIAIATLWNARIVHRDIKPNNVMLSTDGSAILIDLGLARHLDLSPITTFGKTWGTQGYFSPEHAHGAPLTCKSDVFALGIVLQEALLGRHPTGRRQAAIMNGGPLTSTLRPNISPTMAALIDSMVHKTPFYRPMPMVVANRMNDVVDSLGE